MFFVLGRGGTLKFIERADFLLRCFESDRPEGSNSLFFQFGDGASIELQNFYTAYNKEEMPEFQIDGQIIAGTDFFQAFGPDLLPAAGPAASAERGARFSVARKGAHSYAPEIYGLADRPAH